VRKSVSKNVLYSPRAYVRIPSRPLTTLTMDKQGQLNLEVEGEADGYTHWLAGRRLAVNEMARRLNLPLGHQVEVWLADGICLRGQLRLQEEVLFIEEERVRHLQLRIDRTCFDYRDLESCVRLD